MKKILLCAAALTLFATIIHPLSTAFAQGTAFTYQGRLNGANGPANGSYDLTFSLFTVGSGGSVAAGPLTNSATGLTNGLFIATLDFGGGVFNGTTYWLEIAARTNGAVLFTNLAPRQQLTPAPYAIYAAIAGSVTNGAISPSQLQTLGLPSSGQVLFFNGSSLVWSNAASGAWSLTGNAGTTPGINFLGTTDNR